MARYFVHLPPDRSPAVFWRDAGNFAGEWFQYNFSLLALMLGDNPHRLLPAGASLVPERIYNFGTGTVSVQPFAFTRPSGTRPKLLPIGPNLKSVAAILR
jgi:hypothetical protein